MNLAGIHTISVTGSATSVPVSASTPWVTSGTVRPSAAET
jgi:hypothetical protein